MAEGGLHGGFQTTMGDLENWMMDHQRSADGLKRKIKAIGGLLHTDMQSQFLYLYQHL